MCAGVLWAAACSSALAQSAEEGDRVLLIADEIIHAEQENVVSASGAVELSRGDEVLRADTLRYDRDGETVSASGNVVLLAPGGEVVFAKQVDLADDLKSGTIHSVGVLFPDRSRFAAAGGRKTVDGRMELVKAVYSSCALCEEDPEQAPLWQIKASRVVHDSTVRTITYHDPRLEVLGAPILYVPYLTQPDPSVRRTSGFLAPIGGQSTAFGLTWAQPYFFALSPHSDATFTPILATDGLPVLTGQYRRATESGAMRFEASMAHDKATGDGAAANRRPRGHVNLVGDFQLPGGSDYGFTLERASDPTYLARYDFGGSETRPEEFDRALGGDGTVLEFARGRPFLTQNIYLHSLQGSRKITFDAFHFQDLGPEEDPGRTPFVAPLIGFAYRSAPGFAGSVWTASGNMRALTRFDGRDNRRVSAAGGWQVPFSTRIGDRYTIGVSLRADAYHVGRQPDEQNPGDTRGADFVTRVLPQAVLDWRWPWIRPTGNWHLIVEPLAKAVVAPNGGNPPQIDNDDSLAFEFDEINLFSENRFPGLDRVEGGVRSAYALRVGAFGPGDAYAEFLLGQTFRLQDDDTFEVGTGLANTFSDLVGRILVRPVSLLDLTTRFRLDRDTFSVRRGSLTLAAGPEWLRGELSYITLSSAAPTASVPEPVEQIEALTRYRVTDQWLVGLRSQHDLSDTGGGPIYFGGGVFYEDECLRAGIELRRNFTRRDDIEDFTGISFQVQLRGFN